MSTTQAATPKKPALAGPVSYTLLVPVEIRGADDQLLETVRELKLDRIRGPAARRCMNAYATGAGDFAFELVCASARIPPSTFNQLDAEDVVNLTELATPFFKSGQPTT